MDVALNFLYSAFQSETEIFEIERSDETPETVKVSSYILSNLASKAIFDIMANGSEPDSEEQISLLDHSHGKPLPWVNEIFPLTTEFLTATGEANGPRISYTTAIWLNRLLTFKEHFYKVIQEFYKPDFYQFDSNSQVSTNGEALKRQVNEWVKKNTQGLITESLGSYAVTPHTGFVLASAISFEGEWFEPFRSAGSQKFRDLSGKEVDLPFMTSTGKHYLQQFEKFKLLSIPFKQHKASNFSMLFYLPDDILDTEDLRDFIGKCESVIQDVYFPEEQVQVGNFLIPKFKLNLRGSMVIDYHISEIADFAEGMKNNDHRLSSYIEFNERGIRAAGNHSFFIHGVPELPSLSAALLSTIQSRSVKSEEFVANRPFIFFIRDNRFGRMLFSGGLFDPIGASPSFKAIGE